MTRYVSYAWIEALQQSGANAVIIEAAMRSTKRAQLGDAWPQGSWWRKQWE